MKKILLIDDDEVFANVYRNKLLHDGFQVEVASDGQAGYDLVRTFRPDAILLDLLLPILPGLEVIRKLRAEAEYKDLPLIVFTNSFLSSTIQAAWQAGATKCLTKANCTPKEVISAIHSVLTPAPTQLTVAVTSTATTSESVADETDLAFQEELKTSFAAEFPGHIARLRAQLQSAFKLAAESAKAELMRDMNRKVRPLAVNAGMVGMSLIAQLASALEALLKELAEKPATINTSTLRTIASAIDCLMILFEQPSPTGWDISKTRTLVVDDESISRRAVTHALDKAKLHSVSIEDPLKAFDLVTQSRFDLIFLDVDMPNMNGYELCTKIRTHPAYKKTPIVFVTSLNDLEARAHSTMSGGNDFIAKPFLFIELAVKALIYLSRSQLPPAKKTT